MKYLFIFFVLFFSCNKTEKLQEKEKINSQNFKKNDSTAPRKTTLAIQDTIVDDNFIAIFIEKDLLITNYKNNLKITKVEIEKNDFNPSTNDSLIYYTNSLDTLSYYKTTNKSMITYLSFQENISLIKSFSTIGMNKNNYEKYFKIENVNNNLYITDTEQGNIINLKFKNKKLVNVIYRMTYLE